VSASGNGLPFVRSGRRLPWSDLWKVPCFPEGRAGRACARPAALGRAETGGRRGRTWEGPARSRGGGTGVRRRRPTRSRGATAPVQVGPGMRADLGKGIVVGTGSSAGLPASRPWPVRDALKPGGPPGFPEFSVLDREAGCAGQAARAAPGDRDPSGRRPLAGFVAGRGPAIERGPERRRSQHYARLPYLLRDFSDQNGSLACEDEPGKVGATSS
jgi:hypothetical protein